MSDNKLILIADYIFKEGEYIFMKGEYILFPVKCT